MNNKANKKRATLKHNEQYNKNDRKITKVIFVSRSKNCELPSAKKIAKYSNLSPNTIRRHFNEKSNVIYGYENEEVRLALPSAKTCCERRAKSVCRNDQKC